MAPLGHNELKDNYHPERYLEEYISSFAISIESAIGLTHWWPRTTRVYVQHLHLKAFLFCEMIVQRIKYHTGVKITQLYTGDSISLQWRHNELAGVSNHQPHHCLLNRLFRRRSKKTSKLRVTGLCAENSPGTGEFPAQMACNAENVSIWWRHHVVHITYTSQLNCACNCVVLQSMLAYNAVCNGQITKLINYKMQGGHIFSQRIQDCHIFAHWVYYI